EKLEGYTQLMAVREERVMELESTINELRRQLGREPGFGTAADPKEELQIAREKIETEQEKEKIPKYPRALLVDREAAKRAGVEKPQLEIALIPVICSAPLLYAHSHGFFARNGLEVKLLPAPGWSGIKNLMAYGKVDAAHMPAPMPLACSLGIDGKQADIRLSAIQNINGQALTLAKKHLGIKNVQDMKGFTFGVPYRFSMNYYLLAYFLAANGIDPLKDVTIKEIAPPGMPHYLKKGWVDGVFAPGPFNQVPVYQGTGFIYILSKDIWSG
ncbi:MAG: ABC transporter substrate-binding protein, partial [bacterium]|nr:ABC transporter substrate-binding protein [bacterium]